jgi:hypothetical protein
MDGLTKLFGTDLCFFQKAFTCRCWAGAKVTSLKNLDANPTLKQRNASARCRLRDIQGRCCTPKATMLSREYRVFQETQIEHKIRHIKFSRSSEDGYCRVW